MSMLLMVIELLLRYFLVVQDSLSQFLRLYLVFFSFFSQTHAIAQYRRLVFLQTVPGLTLYRNLREAYK